MKQKILELKQGEEMPKDFWKYKVNPITGYYIEPQHYNKISERYKYGLRPIKTRQ